MRTAELLEQTEFHDAAVLAMTAEGDRVRLEFGDVWAAPDERCNVEVTMGGVREMTCDEQAVEALEMDQDDGSVIAFRRSGKTAELVVTWTSYRPRTDKTKAYTFAFKTFDLRVTGSDQSQPSRR